MSASWKTSIGLRRVAVALAVLIALAIPNPGHGTVLGAGAYNVVDTAAMAFDSLGHTHMAYINYDGDVGLYYATNASGSWVSRPIATTGYEWQPRVFVDSWDVIHIIFIHRVDTQYMGIYQASNAGGSWYVERLVKDNLVQHGAAAAMTPDGAIHLAWDGAPYGFLGLFYAKYASGVVTVTQLPLGNHGTGSPMGLAIASDGSAHIAFEESSPYSNISVVSNAGGTWHFVAAQAFAGWGPTLGREADGKIHLLWAAGGYFYDSLEDASSSRTLAQNSNSATFYMSYSPAGVPALLIDKNGGLGNRQVFVVRGGATPDEAAITSHASFFNLIDTFNISVDSSGKRHVIYKDPDVSADSLLYSEEVALNGTWSTPAPLLSWPVIGDAAPVTTPLSQPVFFGRLGTDGSVPMLTEWQPTTAGYVGFDIARSTDGAPFQPIGSPTAGTWSQTLLSDKRYQHEVRSRYDGSSTSPWVPDAAVNLARIEETSTLLTYTGTWTRVAQTAATGGGVKTTKSTGSAVSLTTTARSVSLVATTGRTMALVNIYVNGVLCKTVDLKRAENNITRRVVWTGQFTTAQTRTIKFVAVKKGTRVRVDFDAVIALI